MATVQIEHPIRDYEMWLTAFNRLADIRSTAGVVDGRVSRPIDNPAYIVVSLDFDTTEHAVAFLDFLETQIWASSEAAPALQGRPRTAILQPAPAAVVLAPSVSGAGGSGLSDRARPYLARHRQRKWTKTRPWFLESFSTRS